MGRKLSYLEVKETFEKRGYKLLESEYKGKDITIGWTANTICEIIRHTIVALTINNLNVTVSED
ncbi:hypothetical protein R4Z09_12145 [Niallia oryzisoli]|uniref:Uncharacterized protein n=1 Tax=Niallia oryzisoli TaxID=1737571 RepID=A0ABZ2CKZ4_9BACI